MDRILFLFGASFAFCSSVVIDRTSHRLIGLGVTFALIAFGFFILSGASMISDAIWEKKSKG